MGKKRLLIYAHYYYPDVASTGQLMQELAESMRMEFDVTVLCVVPSYEGIVPTEYKTRKYYDETLHGVHLIRVRVPEFRKDNKASRLRNILTYVFRAFVATFKASRADYVLTISQPPILGGLLGVFGKWIKHARLIYCIQDFNPEQILAVGYTKSGVLLHLMMWLDKFNCRQSDLVVTVGRDLVETLKKRFEGRIVPRYIQINNWVDKERIYPLASDDPGVVSFREKHGISDQFVFMYSGNIGLYYDLENLIKVFERFPAGTKAADGREVAFVFVGTGSMLDRLRAYKNAHGMSNVTFLPYQKKEELLYSLNAADVHLCVNAKGIKGVSCPSKYYGIAAVRKPVLAVLEIGSEIASIIEETAGGLISEPGDYDAVAQNIQWFLENAGSEKLSSMGERGYDNLVNNNTKDASVQKYIHAILALDGGSAWQT